jgi:hypothetical protein
VLNRRPRAIHGTPIPLQQLNSGCHVTPNIVYKETLGDAMAPACPQRDPPLPAGKHYEQNKQKNSPKTNATYHLYQPAD